jgi:hypothetical protein
MSLPISPHIIALTRNNPSDFCFWNENNVGCSFYFHVDFSRYCCMVFYIIFIKTEQICLINNFFFFKNEFYKLKRKEKGLQWDLEKVLKTYLSCVLRKTRKQNNIFLSFRLCSEWLWVRIPLFQKKNSKQIFSLYFCSNSPVLASMKAK